ncbi:MAG: hypothetical protein FJ012_04890 [Chloroflexi bacterium]|nr:hypothetical protein [Chloroflexota bacterium]
MTEGKHIQKWIGCPVSDEEFERHNERRKQLGMTWAQYIMPAVNAQLDTVQVSVEGPAKAEAPAPELVDDYVCAYPTPEAMGIKKAKKKACKVKRSKV